VGDEVSRWVGRRLADGGLSGPYRRLEARLEGAKRRSKPSRRSWRALVVPQPRDLEEGRRTREVPDPAGRAPDEGSGSVVVLG